MKTHLTLSVDSELVRLAHEQNVNLSELMQITLEAWAKSRKCPKCNGTGYVRRKK